VLRSWGDQRATPPPGCADLEASVSYPGSLTTPPCTEGVRWEIFDEAIEMSKAQIDRYTGVYDDNRRPLQLLHGRRPALGGGPTARPGR
jgi:hypothetical protein